MESPTGMRYKHPKISSKRVMHGDIQQIWTRQHTRLSPSRDRIQACKDVREGKKMFNLPVEFDVPGAESLIVSLPQKITVPLKTVNVLSRKQPRLLRNQVGNTLQAGLTAGNIETWVNAAVEKEINWGELIGKLFLDGECAVIVIPSLADWQHSPDFMDSLSAEEFEELDEETQARYCRVDEYDEPILDEFEEDEGYVRGKGNSNTRHKRSLRGSDRYVRVDDSGNPLPNPRYLRDGFKGKDYPYGREPGDRYYTDNPRRKFKENRKNTEKAFEVEQQHWLSEELPFRISIVSASQCYPVFGTDQKLEGLVVKRTFSRETLVAHDYIWQENDDLLQENANGEGEVVLYEYWGKDRDGSPYVAYSVNGAETHFGVGEEDEDGNRKLTDAIIDLRKEFGLRKLPVMYSWGLHWETDDVKMKGVPFLWPVLGAITGVEALSTSILVHSYSTAFGSWGVSADPQIIRDYPEILSDNGRPRSYVFAPLTTTILPGRPYPLVHPGTGKDVKDLLNMLMQASASMAPSDIAFGAGNATSGHDRALSREYLETSMNQVLDGALKAYQFIGECVLELCSGITKMTGVPVPVYATVKVPQITGQKNRTNTERQMVELKPEWVGPIFSLEAHYSKSAGENLAEMQQLAQLHLQGLVTFREFREKGFGDENPAATLIEIFTDQYLRTDAGKSEIAQLAAEMMGADAEDEKQKLIDEKKLTEGGTPMAALPPELQALNTGQIPPGVDPELFLTKLQGMLAHDAARNALEPAGVLGGIPSPGATGPLPQQGAAPGLPGGANIPPAMNPQGAPGPAGPAPSGSGEQAPTLSGMGVPSGVDSQLGGIIAGEMGTASRMRDDLARANIG